MQEKLTPREQDILNLLLEGTSPKEIGHKLNISYHTVDFHRTKIYRKLGVKSFQELLSIYGRQSAAVIPEEPAVPPGNNPDKRFKLVIFAAIIVLAVSILPVRNFLSKPSAQTFAEKPFTVILNHNEPFDYTFRFHPSAFNETKITAGDNYTLTYSFTSNVDVDLLFIYFLDQTVEADGNWTVLSSTAHLKGDIKANIEYNGYLTIIPTKTASSTEPNANLLCIDSKPHTSSQPTITFTRFEIVKNN